MASKVSRWLAMQAGNAGSHPGASRAPFRCTPAVTPNVLPASRGKRLYLTRASRAWRPFLLNQFKIGSIPAMSSYLSSWREDDG